MSASFGGGGDGEVELNIAPIVDCFTVLIAYMLVSAASITLGILEVGVAASGESTQQPETIPKEPPLSMTITVLQPPVAGQPKSIEFKVFGGPQGIEEVYAIPSKVDGNWDQEVIKAKLLEITGKHATLAEANVNADNDIEYKEIIQIIQAVKTNLKKVYLAG